jgi:hypothetical protein
MASRGYLHALLGPLPDRERRTLRPVLDHALTTLSIGATTGKSANFSWVIRTGTTNSTSGDEFSIEHGLGQAPTWVLPVLDVASTGSALVPLTVSRAADSRRLYFTSTSTNVAFTIVVEP